MDYLLRTTSKAQMDAALIAAGVGQQITEQGETVVQGMPGVAIDRFGPCGADTRYHANVRIADGVAYDATELPTFTPLPVTPYRVWFD